MTPFSEMRRIHDIQTRLRTGNIAASDRLDVPTLAYLEHPTDSAARERFQQFLILAASTGVIPAERETFASHAQNPFQRVAYWITRSDYRQWRAQCPQELLSALSLIYRWLEKPPSGKREILKAGVEWRHQNPGQSRARLQAALADQFGVEILNGWVDEIMAKTPEVPKNKGGKTDP